MTEPSPVVGLDASNLSTGGSRTHLVHLLQMARPEEHGIQRIVIWGSSVLLDQIEDRDWLDKRTEPWLDRGLASRLAWQRLRLPSLARDACDLLFAPGGSAPHRFRPVVTMSRNMLPFELHERRRYRGSRIGVRLGLLRLSQARTFRRADGLVFLTQYACDVVTRTVPRTSGVEVIPHGVDDRFRMLPRPQRRIEECTFEDPLVLLYVSIIDLYKHHGPVARAVARLRTEGLPVVIDFLGPAYPPALRSFEAVRDDLDPEHTFLRYLGPVPHDDLPERYSVADAFVFASSCENMPNILLEAMAAGLPLASSNRGPMPEVLACTGELFDPEDVDSITGALRRLVIDPELRRSLALAAYRRALEFSWERCAGETLAFLRSVYDETARA